MPRCLVIGDIHGCYAELLDLLDRAGLGTGDWILAVGDVLDRGPDSQQVLDFCSCSCSCPGVARVFWGPRRRLWAGRPAARAVL